MHEYTTLYEGTSWLRTTISGTANVLSVTILSGKGNIRFNQELHTSQFNVYVYIVSTHHALLVVL
jgi:hypothetical protein